MSWYHKDGPELTVSVTVGGTAVSANDVVQFSSGTVIAATDGCLVAGVMHDDGDANETNVKLDVLMPGSIWEVTVSSQTINQGTKVAMAGASNVDAGTSTNPSVGIIINGNVASGDTTAQILVLGGTPTID